LLYSICLWGISGVVDMNKYLKMFGIIYGISAAATLSAMLWGFPSLEPINWIRRTEIVSGFIALPILSKLLWGELNEEY
jgi:hypothetical protein